MDDDVESAGTSQASAKKLMQSKYNYTGCTEHLSALQSDQGCQTSPQQSGGPRCDPRVLLCEVLLRWLPFQVLAKLCHLQAGHRLLHHCH